MDFREKATNPNPSFSAPRSPGAGSPEALPASGVLASGAFAPGAFAPGARALWPAVFLVIGAFLWLYGATLWQLGISWSGDEYYSHGPLIPFISAYLIWQKRALLRAAWQPGTNVFWGFVWLLTGLAIAFFGFLTDINFVRAFSIPVVILGLARIFGGGAFQKPLFFPVLLFAAGVPISRVVVQTFSVPLQKMAAGGASLVLGVMGLGVESDGVNISTPGFHFVVDVPCSGLKTITALLTVGLVVAYVVRELPMWARVLLAVSSVPVAIVSNVIRILLIIQIGLNYGREAAEGFLHGFSNVITMALALSMLLAFGHFLHLKTRRDEDEYEEDDEENEESRAAPPSVQLSSAQVAALQAPLLQGATPQFSSAQVAASQVAASVSASVSASQGAAPQPNLTEGGVSGGAPLLPSPRLGPLGAPSLRLVAVMVALLVGTQLVGASALMAPGGGLDRRQVAGLQLPVRSGAWSGQNVKVDPAVFEMLRPDAAVQKRYTLRAGQGSEGEDAPPPGSQVDVIVIYNSDSRGFHAPEICLRAGGWTLSDRDTRIVGQGKDAREMTLVSGERKGDRTHLAYYFEGTEAPASGWVAMLTREALGRVTRKRTGSLEVQFAFGSGALQSNGDFKPQLSALMLDVARSVRAQLVPKPAAR